MSEHFSPQDWSLLMGQSPFPIGSVVVGLDVPSNHLDWFQPFQDFLFCRASEALRSPSYATWFLRRAAGHQDVVMLDNGTAEYGFPTHDQTVLGELAEMVGAGVVMAPDFHDDASVTVASTKSFIARFGETFDIMGVVQGKSIHEQLDCTRKLMDSGVELLGFPRHPNRLKLIRALADLHLLERSEQYALLGFMTLEEIHALGDVGQWTWLLLTGVPISAALDERSITPSYQHKKADKYAVGAHVKLSDRQLQAATMNVVRFQELLPASSAPAVEEDDED